MEPYVQGECYRLTSRYYGVFDNYNVSGIMKPRVMRYESDKCDDKYGGTVVAESFGVCPKDGLFKILASNVGETVQA